MRYTVGFRGSASERNIEAQSQKEAKETFAKQEGVIPSSYIRVRRIAKEVLA